MAEPEVHVARIKKSIQVLSDPRKAEWLENYVKHGVRSRGVSIPKIRNVVREYVHEVNFQQAPWKDKVHVLDGLMASDYAEDKLAAIIYLQLFGEPVIDQELIKLIEGWFDQSWISDWNICDWLCVRLLTPLLNQGSEFALSTFRQWCQADYLWKARAALVPFAQCAHQQEYKKDIEYISDKLIRRDERFAKTAVGWVLREYSKHDPGFVNQFLRKYRDWTTSEVVRNATKYL